MASEVNPKLPNPRVSNTEAARFCAVLKAQNRSKNAKLSMFSFKKLGSIRLSYIRVFFDGLFIAIIQ